MIHGGFWQSAYGLDLGAPTSADLARRGWAAWNIEYRRLGDGGGWPTTFTDVAAAVDHLHRLDGVDLGSVVTLGHSAGGQLAVWAARGTRRVTARRASRGCGSAPPLSQAGRARPGRGGPPPGLGGTRCPLRRRDARPSPPERYAAADPSSGCRSGCRCAACTAPTDDRCRCRRAAPYVDAARAAGDDAPAGPGARRPLRPDRPRHARRGAGPSEVLGALTGAPTGSRAGRPGRTVRLGASPPPSPSAPSRPSSTWTSCAR